ncbi:LIN28B [Cordylochernes scorpioides]|uniref:LIN28B n=1 Tax=Cordylochernes scorpioides TaxID=51811 RepID=A0ABY6KZN2_9ARAC|nr:LIN28B [Cordylochernes scorpioides]
MSGFRSLASGEEVRYRCRRSERGGLEASEVEGLDGAPLRGVPRPGHRRQRCYNCGELARHKAAHCTLGPLPKRCLRCRSPDHLIAACPFKSDLIETGTQTEEC